MGRLAFVLFLALHKLGNKVREGARSHLHPQILQCLQRNNGWEPCLRYIPMPQFPQCKIWIKTLKGGFLALERAWASINTVMLMVFSPFCYEILLKHLSLGRNPSPEAPSQNGSCARRRLHLLSHPDRRAACGRSHRAGVASALSP